MSIFCRVGAVTDRGTVRAIRPGVGVGAGSRTLFPNSAVGSKLFCYHFPSTLTLIPHTGIQRDLILGCGRKAAGVGFTDLFHRDHFISPGPQLGGQGNGIPIVQLMDAPEVVVDSTIMRGQAAVSVPDGGVTKMASALFQCGIVCALINFDIQPDGGDLQGPQGAVGIDGLPVNETSTTVMPMDPMLMVVAVALMTIEKKLDGIQKSVEEVLQFLKLEKQSRQRGNLNMLAEIMEEYKENADDQKRCELRNGEVQTIRREALQDILFYQEQIATELQKQKSFHGTRDVQTLLNSVTYQFAEYQLACHIYAFSTFLDVMLQKSFDAATIESAIKKMADVAKRYGELYSDCHAQLAKYQRSAIETQIVGGFGAVTFRKHRVFSGIKNHTKRCPEFRTPLCNDSWNILMFYIFRKLGDKVR